MPVSLENFTFFLISLGVVFGLLRLYFQGYQDINPKKSRTLLISLPILILMITFLPTIKNLHPNNDWFEMPFYLLIAISLLWLHSFKDEVLPSFTDHHWLILPGSISMLILANHKLPFQELKVAYVTKLFFLAVIIFLAGILLLFRKMYGKSEKRMQKYLLLFFLNCLLSFILLIPLSIRIIKIVNNIQPLNLTNALTLILASSSFPYPFLYIAYLINKLPREKESTASFQSRIEKEKNFIRENNLYRENSSDSKKILAFIFMVAGIAGIWIFEANVILTISLLYNLSFFI